MEKLKYTPTNTMHNRTPETVVRGGPRQWWGDEREKRYAYLKHRSQCMYRKEPYDLSWEDWNELWTDELFAKRGRGKDDLCLARVNIRDSWNLFNCIVYTRHEHLKRNGEFRK